MCYRFVCIICCMFVVLFSFRWLSFVYIYPSRLAEHVLVYCRSIIVMRAVWRRPGFESAALGIVVSIGKERHHTASWTMLHRASKACGRFEFCRCLIPLRRMLSMNGCRRGFYQIGGGRIATISTLVLDVDVDVDGFDVRYQCCWRGHVGESTGVRAT